MQLALKPKATSSAKADSKYVRLSVPAINGDHQQAAALRLRLLPLSARSIMESNGILQHSTRQYLWMMKQSLAVSGTRLEIA